MTLQTKVKTRLAELNMTLGQLAKLIEVSQPYLSLILKGERRLSAKHIKAMAKHLQVPESFFFTDEYDVPTERLVYKSAPSKEVLDEYNKALEHLAKAHDIIARLAVKVNLKRNEGELSRFNP